MAVPAGAWRRAAFVAVPLALLALIFVTPVLMGRQATEATDIPSLVVQITGDPWNASVNESVILYVSALGTPLYDHIGFSVGGVDAATNLTELTGSCGGMGVWVDANWTCESSRVPTLWMKLPAIDDAEFNVTALTVHGEARFRYNATVRFVWDEVGWFLAVTPEGDSGAENWLELFTASMRQEPIP